MTRKAFYDTRAGYDEEDEDEDLGPSKSELKRQSEAMQKLGEELTRMPPEQFARIDLPEDIRDAIGEYARMKSFGAKRRQLQLIGKLMRRLDGAAVREAIERATGESHAAVAAMHRAEKMREAMLAGDAPVTAFAEAHPQADIQRIRQLVRAARKEAAEGKPPKSVRLLYKALYEQELPALNLEKATESNSEEES